MRPPSAVPPPSWRSCAASSAHFQPRITIGTDENKIYELWKMLWMYGMSKKACLTNENGAKPHTPQDGTRGTPSARSVPLHNGHSFISRLSPYFRHKTAPVAGDGPSETALRRSSKRIRGNAADMERRQLCLKGAMLGRLLASGDVQVPRQSCANPYSVITS